MILLTIPRTFDPPPGPIGNRLAIVAEYLQLRTSMTLEARGGFFINVHWKKWRSMLGKSYAETLRHGADIGLLHINHRYSDGSIVPKFTKGFRLTTKHRHGRSKPFEMKSKPLAKRYAKAKELDPDNLGDIGMTLAGMFPLFRLSDKAVTDPALKAFWSQWTVNRFINQQTFALRDSFAGRFHSLFTQLPKVARKHLTTSDGDSFSIVDVSACQPLIIGILTNQQQPTTGDQPTSNPQRREPTGATWNPTTNMPPLFQNSTNRKLDVQKWIELCEGSEFYRFLWEATRNQPDPAIATITKPSGRRIKVDLRDTSLPSFKRSCLIPLFDQNRQMFANPVFQVIQREFPTVADYVIRVKKSNYKALPKLAQSFEATLMIDGAARQFVNTHAVPTGTIHDALMIPSTHATRATDTIAAEFERFGVHPNIKIESLTVKQALS